jgi:hypothetical protein
MWLMKATSSGPDDIWAADMPHKDRTLWNANIFPIAYVPPKYGGTFRGEIISEECSSESYSYLFFLQYLRRSSEGSLELNQEHSTSLRSNIERWKSSERLSLSDLLRRGDARGMHDWKGYLQSIQRDESALPLPSSSSSFSNTTSSALHSPSALAIPGVSSGVRAVNGPHTVKDCALSEMTISRCTYGDLFVRAPSYHEVLCRVDSVYQSYSRAVKIVVGILGRGKPESNEIEGELLIWHLNY